MTGRESAEREGSLARSLRTFREVGRAWLEAVRRSAEVKMEKSILVRCRRAQEKRERSSESNREFLNKRESKEGKARGRGLGLVSLTGRAGLNCNVLPSRLLKVLPIPDLL